MINKGLFTSSTDEWATPQDFFRSLDEEFHFTLDPCSTDNNAKCKLHYTLKDNGLEQDWGGGKLCFATLRMAEQSKSGCGRHTRNPQSQTLLWLCLSLQELIPPFFMITSTTRQKRSASSAGDSTSTKPDRHHSRQWW